MYERDDLRQGHWRYDYRRSGIRWQKSIIISCSRIRLLEKSENAQSHLFATVNSNNTNSKSASFNNRNIVLLWRLTERNLTLARAPIDSIRDIQQVYSSIY